VVNSYVSELQTVVNMTMYNDKSYLILYRHVPNNIFSTQLKIQNVLRQTMMKLQWYLLQVVSLETRLCIVVWTNMPIYTAGGFECVDD